MAKKPKTIARLLDDCAVVLQKIVRMKAAIHAEVTDHSVCHL